MRAIISKFAKMIHRKCRNGHYPSSQVDRFRVADEQVAWDVDFPDYRPSEFTSPVILGKSWADLDLDDPQFNPNWNQIDGSINRQSYLGKYTLTEDNRPLNPIGRTGIIGRGILGRWGPNHAADPIITRWKRNGTGALEIDRNTEKPILQFVAIQRRDTMEWAIPGGMVDLGETVSTTLKREFMEEAMDSLQKDESEIQEIEKQLEKFFNQGEELYKGYVDDPRNTDNAWIETVATNFHDEDGSTVGELKLKAGDDATNVRWMDVSGNIKLYASHCELLKQTAHKRNAHW